MCKIDHFFTSVDQLRCQQSEISCNNITISDRDNRKIILVWLFKTNIQVIEELISIYDKLQEYDTTSWSGYTDGSLIRYDNSNKIDMGLGWVIVLDNKQIVQFHASSFEWPSSTRMELLAVVSLISTLPAHSSINIFTDSNNVIEKYKKFKSYILYRKKKKIMNFNL
jgi:hypothetical protein